MTLDYYKAYFMALIIVMISFILHELAHKFVAIKYGMFARYHASYQGLIISFIIKLIFGVTLIIPGAVVIHKLFRHKSKKRERIIEGIISISGPLVNIFISLFFIVLFFTYNNNLFYTIAYFNIFLAIFNLLPIPPLDGFKVIRWSFIVYGLTFILSLTYFFIIFL